MVIFNSYVSLPEGISMGKTMSHGMELSSNVLKQANIGESRADQADQGCHVSETLII